MECTNFTSEFESFSLITKANSPLVMFHITVFLEDTYSPEMSVLRSLWCDLLLSGAGSLSRDEFLDAVNEAGGSIVVSSNAGRVTITIETLESRLVKILDYVELMLISPNFLKSEISRAKITYRKQLKVAAEQARAMANTLLTQAIYLPTEQYYQFTPDEEEGVISHITRSQLQQLHKKVLSHEWKISIGGNEKVTRKIAKRLEKIHSSVAKCSARKTDLIPTLPTRRAQILTHQISSQQNIEVSIGQRLSLSVSDPEYPAIFFALAVLGKWGGFSGRLMNTVREKSGLTYGIYCRTEGAEKLSFGHWRIMTFFHPKDLEQGIIAVVQEVEKFYQFGITTTELVRFKKIFNTGHTLLADSLIAFTNTSHTNHLLGITFADYETLKVKINNLTRSEINTAIKKFIDPKALVFAFAGNLTPLNSQLHSLQTRLNV